MPFLTTFGLCTNSMTFKVLVTISTRVCAHPTQLAHSFRLTAHSLVGRRIERPAGAPVRRHGAQRALWGGLRQQLSDLRQAAARERWWKAGASTFVLGLHALPADPANRRILAKRCRITPRDTRSKARMQAVPYRSAGQQAAASHAPRLHALSPDPASRCLLGTGFQITQISTRGSTGLQAVSPHSTR